MKIKNVIGISALLLTFGLGVAFASSSKNVVKADAATDVYSIENDQYELAMMEGYGNDDRPIDSESKLLGLYLYDSGVQVNYSSNLLFGVNDSLQWRFSSVRGYYNSTDKYYNVILRTGTKYTVTEKDDTTGGNICNTDNTVAYGADTDEYKIGADISYDYAGAMISKTVIKNIQDISFYWRYASSSLLRGYIYYQLENQTTWQRYVQIRNDTSGRVAGNVSGSRGWDTYGYTTFNSSSWSSHPLHGANAKIAFVVAANSLGKEIQLSAVSINASKGAVRYLNALSYRNNICTDGSAFDLTKSVSDSSSNLYSFQLATEHADGNVLANYTVNGSKTSETTALGLYNYLVTSMPVLGDVKAANSRVFNIVATFEDNGALVVVISIASLAAAGCSLLAIKKHKKQQ